MSEVSGSISKSCISFRWLLNDARHVDFQSSYTLRHEALLHAPLDKIGCCKWLACILSS